MLILGPQSIWGDGLELLGAGGRAGIVLLEESDSGFGTFVSVHKTPQWFLSQGFAEVTGPAWHLDSYLGIFSGNQQLVTSHRPSVQAGDPCLLPHQLGCGLAL